MLARKFENPDVDFIGGPYLPQWAAPKPEWIGREFGGVVGWVESGDESSRMVQGSMACSWAETPRLNAAPLKSVGSYNTSLGRTDKGLLSCEDEDMFHGLLANGFNGMYVPDFVIYHYVPRERMTRRYHRRWCWGRGTSMGILARTRTPDIV